MLTQSYEVFVRQEASRVFRGMAGMPDVVVVGSILVSGRSGGIELVLTADDDWQAVAHKIGVALRTLEGVSAVPPWIGRPGDVAPAGWSGFRPSCADVVSRPTGWARVAAWLRRKPRPEDRV